MFRKFSLSLKYSFEFSFNKTLYNFHDIVDFVYVHVSACAPTHVHTRMRTHMHTHDILK